MARAGRSNRASPAFAGRSGSAGLAPGDGAAIGMAELAPRRDPVAHEHYRAPTLMPVLGAISSAYLASPLSGRDPGQYLTAGLLVLVGIALWLVNRQLGGQRLKSPDVPPLVTSD